jgi:hypothetical protein
MYAIWNQWQETTDGKIYNSDAWFRRVMFSDTLENPTPTGGGGGVDTGGGGTKPKPPKK